MKRLFSILCAVALVLSLAACGSSAKTEEKVEASSGVPAVNTEVKEPESIYPEGMEVSDAPFDLAMAFGTTAGSGYVTASVVSQLIMDQFPRYTAKPEVTTGSVENINLLRSGAAQIGICMADVAEAAYNGTREFDASTQININFIGGGFPTILNIVVPKDSTATSIKDLAGKKLGLANGTMAQFYWPMILEAYGLSASDFNTSNMSVNDCIAGIKDDILDGCLFVGIVPTASMTELAQTNGFQLLSIESEVREKITGKYPSFFNYTIEKDIYGTPADAETIATRNILICREDMDEQVIFDFLTIMMDHQEELKSAHVLAGMFGDNLENVFESQVIPMHPGAQKFYESRGMM